MCTMRFCNSLEIYIYKLYKDCPGHIRMVVSMQSVSITDNVRIPFRRGVLDTTSCDKVCQWLPTSRWFSPGTPVYSTNKFYILNYNCNIVESGVEHHNSKPLTFIQKLMKEWANIDNIVWLEQAIYADLGQEGKKSLKIPKG